MTRDERLGYDSRPDTLRHIAHVRSFLRQIIGNLENRADDHDQSKLRSPEVECFDEFTPKLAATTYGSDEYRELLAAMNEGLAHHYAANRHHPEHFKDGFAGMNLLDVVEMLADWKAATLRHSDGDLARSIEVNAERFGYGPEVAALLATTAHDLGWLPARQAAGEGT